MRPFATWFTMLVASLLLAPSSRAQGVELFGGYSFVRAPVTYTQTAQLCVITGCTPTSVKTHLNLNGWEASAAFKVLGPLAWAADFSGTYASFHGANTHLQTYLTGPQVRFPGPVSPFAHLLLGAAHESIGNGASGGSFYSGPTQTDFAAAIGVGIDVKILPLVSLRAIQIDYLLTKFNSTQHQPRVSAGLVLRF